MKKTLITRKQFKVMPWKNGAGTTAEIAIEPAGADFREGKFAWRLSSARIEDENQFSQFPGYDRILTVLSGEGPTVVSIVTVLVLIYCLSNLLVDLLYGWLDPRIRYDS